MRHFLREPRDEAGSVLLSEKHPAITVIDGKFCRRFFPSQTGVYVLLSIVTRMIVCFALMARPLRYIAQEKPEHDASMIDGFTLTGPGTTPLQQRETGAGENDASSEAAPGFSFNAALITLEGRAAQSLKTFGATPENTVFTAQNAQSQSAERAAAQDASAEQTAPRSTAAAAATTPTAPGDAPVTTLPGAQALAATAQQTPVAAIVAGLSAQAVAQPLAAAAPRLDAAAARTVDARNGALKTANTPAAPRPVATPTQDFASLLARRLDSGATAFELRLDPPQLGRVEAQLIVADDGEAVLALKFENQSTLDLFQRDEAALRAALDTSDFDLNKNRLTFSLADDDAKPTAPENAAADIAALYDEPLFNAPFSQGVVDLRI